MITLHRSHVPLKAMALLHQVSGAAEKLRKIKINNETK